MRRSKSAPRTRRWPTYDWSSTDFSRSRTRGTAQHGQRGDGRSGHARALVAAGRRVRSSSSSTDAGVVAPIAVFQPQPNVPPAVLNLVRQLRGTSKIDVLIKEDGTVEEVTVKQPVSPAYDKLIVAAARRWRYKPALKDGVPIRFVTTVVINASPE